MKRVVLSAVMLFTVVVFMLVSNPSSVNAGPKQDCLKNCENAYYNQVWACTDPCLEKEDDAFIFCLDGCYKAGDASRATCNSGCEGLAGISHGWNPTTEREFYPYQFNDLVTVKIGRLQGGTRCEFLAGQFPVASVSFYMMDLDDMPPGGWPVNTPFEAQPWIELGPGTFDSDRFWVMNINMSAYPSQRGFIVRGMVEVPSDTLFYPTSTFLVKRPSPMTISGDITADNTAMVFTATSEGPGMTVNSYPGSVCWSNVLPFNHVTTDRYIYIAAWSDDNTGQGLLHDFTVTKDGITYPVYSGSPYWTVAPADSNISACDGVNQLAVAAAMASRIPTANFVPTTNGCFNPPVGGDPCYAIWGRVASIDTGARWSWFDSGLQGSGGDIPFKPGFDHRELLIFRLDTQELINTVGVGDEPLKSNLSLRAYPNPTMGTSRLEFRLPEETEANLTVYDVVGRKIATVTNGRLSAGNHRLVWDGRNSDGGRVGPGTYFVRLRAGHQQKTSSVLILQ